MQVIKISGFADEISSDFRTQLNSLNKLGISYIGLRSINGKNILDFSYEEFKNEVYPLLVEFNIEVSSIGSPIGKVWIDDLSGQDLQFRKFQELLKIMDLLETKYVRVFSLYVYNHNEDTFIRVTKFLEELLELVKGKDVTIIHENEKDIYGDSAIYCKKLIKAINNPQLKLAFDPANFVQVGDNAMDAFLMLKDDVLDIHVKDAIYSTKENILVGQGDGYVKEISRLAHHSGFKGFFTLEPHLVEFSYLSNLEKRDDNAKKNTDSYLAFQNTLEVFVTFVK